MSLKQLKHFLCCLTLTILAFDVSLPITKRSSKKTSSLKNCFATYFGKVNWTDNYAYINNIGNIVTVDELNYDNYSQDILNV